MPVKQIDIPNIGPVQLTKRRGSRSIRLSISGNKVRVSLPYWVPFTAGVDFVLAKQAWIKEHISESKIKPLSPGNRIGKAHVLRVMNSSVHDAPKVLVRSNEIVLTKPALMAMDHQAVQAAAQRGAHRALRSEAEQLLPQRLRVLAQANGFEFRGVQVRHLKRRWGSCTQAKDITLNFYLMQLPWQLIDYVLIHELVHTEHLNHGAGFWQRFQQVLPDAKLLRKSMRDYQPAVIAAN